MFSEAVKGQLRHLVTALGAGLIGAKFAQYVAPDMIDTIVGVILLGIGAVLSALSKKYPSAAPIIDALTKSVEQGKVGAAIATKVEESKP